MKKEELIESLKGHSKKYIEMALRTDKCKAIENADGYGKRTGKCGDTVEIFLKMSNDVIDQVRYLVDGCLNTNACANSLVHISKGTTMEHAWNISPDNIIEHLESLPKHEEHCAELACGAFYLALRNAKENKDNSWKKFYKN